MGEKVLEGQVAVVTGGAQGIGRTIAEAFAGAGATLVLADLNAGGAQASAHEIAEGYGVKAEGVGCDVSDAAACGELIDGAAERHGKLDILVNNAGITCDRLLARMTEDDWQKVLNINLNSVFYCSKAAARVMARQRAGRIISLASVGGGCGECGAVQLCGVEGGDHRVQQVAGARGRRARGDGELHCAGVHCDGDDGCAVGPGEGGDREADSAGEDGDGGRRGAGSAVSGRAGGGVFDGGCVAGGWGDGDVGGGTLLGR